MRGLNWIVRCGSGSGAYGLAKKECANGSVSTIVNFRCPSLMLIKSWSNAAMRAENYVSLSTNGLFSWKWSAIFSNSPSTVVNTPPSVPYPSSSSISGRFTAQV